MGWIWVDVIYRLCSQNSVISVNSSGQIWMEFQCSGVWGGGLGEVGDGMVVIRRWWGGCWV